MNKRALVRIILLILLLVFIIFALYLAYQIILIEYPELFNSQGIQGIKETAQKIIPELEPESQQTQVPEVVLPSDALADRTYYLLERQVFNEMNKARTENSLEELQWQEQIANTAFLHSYEMATYNYINHTNRQGLLSDARLANNHIFFLCASENIYYVESRNPTKDLAKEAVKGWLNSPGHRRNLLDGNITKAGVGIYCKDKECYVTANHICTNQIIIQELQKDYVYFFNLYPTNSTFDFATIINYNIAATKEIDIYIVPDQEQYEKYVRRKSFLFTEKYTNIKEIQDSTAIEEEYGIMIIAKYNSKTQIILDY
ncbi:MAG: CAP domain-containing protein [Nanoarchaeota archaeon]|nr:CAP domain-containing protein [Nanoarchaeota archaeon]